MQPACQALSKPRSAQSASARLATAHSMVQALRQGETKDNFDEIAEMARSAYHIALSLKDTINTEHKQFIVTRGGDSTSSSGSIPVTGGINIPAQGDDSNQRIGDSIKLQNLTIRWQHRLAATVYSGKVRFIVFWDEANTVTNPAGFLNVNAVPFGTLSHKVYDNRFLTKILYDKESTLNADTANGAYSHTFEKVIEINKHTQFDVGTTTIMTGALKVAYYSTSAVSTDNLIDFCAAISYTDD